MLTINGRIIFSTPGRMLGVVNNQTGNFSQGLSARYCGGFSSRFSGYPSGALAPCAFILPMKGGAISSYTTAKGLAAGVLSLTPSRPISASSAMVMAKLNAVLARIVSAVASGTLTSAKLQAILAGAASLSANRSLVSAKNNALLGAIFSVTGSASGVASLSSALLTAKAFMEAEAGGATPLSPEGLVSELLDGQEIEGGFTMRESLRVILSALAGKLSGSGTATISIRDVNDLKDRIIASVDGDGNRDAVTLDVD